MNFIQGITILLVFQLTGEVVCQLSGLPIPGPVAGMVFLFGWLCISKKGTPHSVQSAATAILSHLSLLFIPAGVGVMVYFDLIAREWFAIVATLVISTTLTMFVSAFVMSRSRRFFMRRGLKK